MVLQFDELLAPHNKERRFYDSDPLTANSIELIVTFPNELQFILAKGMSMIAQKEHDIDARIKNIRSLGRDVVLPLYKSKQKLRGFDSNTDLHNSVNYLRIMSEGERHAVAKKIIDIASHVEFYLSTCEHAKVEPQVSQAEEIRDTYVEHGPKLAKQFVQLLCDGIISRTTPTPTPTPLRTDISFDDNRIRFDAP